MKKITLFALILFSVFSTSLAAAGTLKNIKSRGYLKCGISTGLEGFAVPTRKGKWVGFDVDYCRALAAATLGDANKVKFIPLTSKTRFEALKSKKIDVLYQFTTWTITRDVGFKFNFPATNFYDGQAFLALKTINFETPKQIEGKTVCFRKRTARAQSITKRYFDKFKVHYNTLEISSSKKIVKALHAKTCDLFVSDRSALYNMKLRLTNNQNYHISSKLLSKEPFSPVVREGDEEWYDIVKWTHYALLTAEELGVDSANVKTIAKSSKNTDILNLLGKSKRPLGNYLGLKNNWAYNIIAQVGNYKQIYDRNLGKNSRLNIPRAMNSLWINDGLQFAPLIK